jgi:hypothetical protein
VKDIYEATQLSGEEELEVSQKSSLTRPFLDQRSFFLFQNTNPDFFQQYLGNSSRNYTPNNYGIPGFGFPRFGLVDFMDLKSG